ncbi:hypothetical protein K493DRAFT_320136, partial [Basidiobolus meristosporus CBS 931.73]
MIPLSLGYLNITFLQEDYRFGLGNISIFDSNYPDYPREVISVVPDPTGLGKSFSMKVSSFTFNTPNHDYFITIDGGTFKSSLNEPLLGIAKNVWTFTTAAGKISNRVTDSPHHANALLLCLYQTTVSKVILHGHVKLAEISNSPSIHLAEKDDVVLQIRVKNATSHFRDR